MRSPLRNRVLVEAVRRTKDNGPVLLFVKRKEHGQLLTRLLERSGIRARFIFGDYSTDGRKTAIRDLVAGRLDVIVCSVVFNKGIDVPSIRTVVVGAGGKSVIAALQRIGRGMRVDEKTGKTELDVIDIADRSCGCLAAAKALGSPGVGVHPGCKWLEKHTQSRLHAYVSEGHSTTTEQWAVT